MTLLALLGARGHQEVFFLYHVSQKYSISSAGLTFEDTNVIWGRNGFEPGFLTGGTLSGMYSLGVAADIAFALGEGVDAPSG